MSMYACTTMQKLLDEETNSIIIKYHLISTCHVLMIYSIIESPFHIGLQYYLILTFLCFQNPVTLMSPSLLVTFQQSNIGLVPILS